MEIHVLPEAGELVRGVPNKVFLVTTTAAYWFTRFGFRRIDRDSVPGSILQSVEFQGACPTTAVIMLREAI